MGSKRITTSEEVFLTETKENRPCPTKYDEQGDWKRMRKVYGTYTQNDALIGQMADVIAHSMDSPPVGKNEAIDLDKVNKRIPACKLHK